MSGVVVVGAGPAAHRFVTRLRQHDHRGRVTVLGAESRPAYNRVLLPLVLAKVLDPAAITLPAIGAHLRPGVTATGIDRVRHLVWTDTGAAYRYDTLVLATGARPNPPAVAGLRAGDGRLRAGVTTLRTLADCARVTGRRVVVLGGGILGVQAALALRRGGHEVTIVHRQAIPLNRLLDAPAGRLLSAQLSDAGLSVHLGRTAIRYSERGLTLDDGTTLMADTVLLCTGAVPDIALARDAGLAVGTGVLVDARMRTDDPDIHAIGDCAEHADDPPGHLTRAWDQADTLAAALTIGHAGHRAGGRITRLTAPGVDIASIGRVAELTTTDTSIELVTLTDPARRRYARLALRDQRIIGAVLVGFPQAAAMIGQLHDRGEPVPSDRLGLLVGAPTRPTGPIELPGEAVICLCNNVTKNVLTHAWRGGAETIQALARSTRATTGCGTCTTLVQRLCATLTAERDAA